MEFPSNMEFPYGMGSGDEMVDNMEPQASTDPRVVADGLSQCNEEQLRRVGYAALLLIKHLYEKGDGEFDNFATCIDTALTWEFG